MGSWGLRVSGFLPRGSGSVFGSLVPLGTEPLPAKALLEVHGGFRV